MSTTTRRTSLAATALVALLAAAGSPGLAATTKRTTKTTKKVTTSAPAATAAPTTAAAPGTAAPAKLTKLNLGVVPVVDLGIVKIAESKGWLKDNGVELNWTQLDAGPNVVTGVISKQFDIGFTAYTPPLLAVAGGQPLRIVTNLAVQGPDGTNANILVKKDSGIARFRDLTGKSLATNAPRSILSLTGVAATSSDGGDGTKVRIVPVPFGEMARQLNDGKVDAAFLPEPFLTRAKLDFPNLVDIGDAGVFALPPETPTTLVFTSTEVLKDKEKAAAIKGFQDAIAKAIDYSKSNPKDYLVAGASFSGLSADQAAKLPVQKFRTKATATELKPIGELMVKFKWVDTAPDVAAFLGA